MLDLIKAVPGARLLYDNGDLITVASVKREADGSTRIGTIHGYRLELWKGTDGRVVQYYGAWAPVDGCPQPVAILPPASDAPPKYLAIPVVISRDGSYTVHHWTSADDAHDRFVDRMRGIVAAADQAGQTVAMAAATLAKRRYFGAARPHVAIRPEGLAWCVTVDGVTAAHFMARDDAQAFAGMLDQVGRLSCA